MIEIEGSYGEGGGQIVRTAVALSAVTGKAVEINNIRKNRPKPGLKAQHLVSLKTAAWLCKAQVSGLMLGSTELSFSPVEIEGGDLEVDIGTAGSITLLLQGLMPALPFAKKEVQLRIRGGTDVAWAPSIDYLQQVTLKALRKMGYGCELELQKRGYYPKGGGVVTATFKPCKLKSFHFLREEKREEGKIFGISHSSNLPSHVAERQAEAAKASLFKAGFSSKIKSESSNFFSTGSGISLWTGFFGGTALGKPGLLAEKVGCKAAKEILPELKSKASVDVYLADQLIPYMALAGESSYTVRKLSQHTKTNIWVTEQFLDVKFRIKKTEKGFEVSVD
ncbi:MAG: RNA 3'-terminal phosphate cyclase [Methanosarcinaceae archaeon]|nr:RNA 3'-terminal phosphate cyclase [Methanosarcinaceae archaeon]MDD4331753.1 RNA 3'-terminal phosphate cyclase [Methanosarcinaceae archaeon]MDD4748355.1 RNA 3'-terminal phosphate cyclase [Methanosarcinaceae archaeon]